MEYDNRDIGIAVGQALNLLNSKGVLNRDAESKNKVLDWAKFILECQKTAKDALGYNAKQQISEIMNNR